MFKRKKSPSTMVNINMESSAPAEVQAADATAPYRDFIEDLALVFPGIKVPDEQYFQRIRLSLYWRPQPLEEYETSKVHAAAEAIRSEQKEKQEAERKTQGQAFIKELRDPKPVKQAPSDARPGGES